MRRYILLSCAGFLSFGLLTYFYLHSESHLVHNNQNVLKLFLTAKNADADLERDLLKSRNFLHLSYDPLVASEASVSEICVNLHDPEYAIYKTMDHAVDTAIDSYCELLESKVNDVEHFKSRNAVFRNSLYYLQKIATDSMLSKSSNADSRMYDLRKGLIEASLTYALMPTADAKLALGRALETARAFLKSESSFDDLDTVSSHADRILETKDELEALTEKIVGSSSTKLLEELRVRYFQNYSKEERSATRYRQLLFGVCAAFLLLIVFGITRLWKATVALLDANANLETRVEMRTLDLQKSQEVVTQQQQILSSTAKMSALGEMAGGIAHEINTPLAIISMRAEQMEECIQDGDFNSLDFVNAIQVIKATTDRIAKIVSGLRFFAREGKHDDAQIVAVKTLVDETLSFCKERIGNHGVSLEIVTSAQPADFDALQVECRAVEITQVLLNLLNNAFDAVLPLQKKWIKVGIEDRAEFVEISVTDSGGGIPIELRDKLMQPFFTTKEIGKGTGLGLSISRGIVVAHQGKIYVDTDSPNTRFVVLLPKFQASTATGKSA